MRNRFILTFLGLLLLFTPVVSMAQLLENDIVVTDAWGAKVDSGTKAFVDRGETWLPVETVKWYSDEQLRFDLAEKRVYVTLGTPRFQLETANLDRTLQKGLTLNFPLKLIAGKPYINLYNLDRILGVTAKPRKEERIVDLIPEASLGYTAYQVNKPRDKAVFTGKINAVWDHVGLVNRNLGIEPAIDGLDVILPTWFTIANADGLVLNKADQRYVADAHEKRYKVWAAFYSKKNWIMSVIHAWHQFAPLSFNKSIKSIHQRLKNIGIKPTTSLRSAAKRIIKASIKLWLSEC
ncbi:hypothetical protein [Anaerospora hongkongensis]|uniref:hypothetical protein n=1 Tax=Anaerospora hongkongensis TaxID=244830 RepID=UPI00289C7D6D|nr:hypothetical protein [Anaerospora hongkongensis]